MIFNLLVFQTLGPVDNMQLHAVPQLCLYVLILLCGCRSYSCCNTSEALFVLMCVCWFLGKDQRITSTPLLYLCEQISLWISLSCSHYESFCFSFLFRAVQKGFLSFVFSLSPFLTPLYSIVQTKGRDNVATHSQPCRFVFNLLFSLLNNTFFLASILPTVAMISSYR